MEHLSINYLAVAVSTFSAMILGALWYGPIFGKAWMAEIGKTEEQLKAEFNPAKTYGLTIIAHFFVSLVIAYLMVLTQANDLSGGLRIGLSLWVAVAGIHFVHGLFHSQSFKLIFMNIGYDLSCMIAYSVILSYWR